MTWFFPHFIPTIDSFVFFLSPSEVWKKKHFQNPTWAREGVPIKPIYPSENIPSFADCNLLNLFSQCFDDRTFEICRDYWISRPINTREIERETKRWKKIRIESTWKSSTTDEHIQLPDSFNREDDIVHGPHILKMTFAPKGSPTDILSLFIFFTWSRWCSVINYRHRQVRFETKQEWKSTTVNFGSLSIFTDSLEPNLHGFFNPFQLDDLMLLQICTTTQHAYHIRIHRNT